MNYTIQWHPTSPQDHNRGSKGTYISFVIDSVSFVFLLQKVCWGDSNRYSLQEDFPVFSDLLMWGLSNNNKIFPHPTITVTLPSARKIAHLLGFQLNQSSASRWSTWQKPFLFATDLVIMEQWLNMVALFRCSHCFLSFFCQGMGDGYTNKWISPFHHKVQQLLSIFFMVLGRCMMIYIKTIRVWFCKTTFYSWEESKSSPWRSVVHFGYRFYVLSFFLPFGNLRN